MGWNSIYDLKSPLFKGLTEMDYVYFVHSYYCEMCDYTAATADYILPYSAALQKDNFFATQFHPEKSAFHCVPNTDRILIWVDLEYAADVLDELLTKCTSQTLLVVNGINKKNHALWKKLQADVHVGITYHLYYCGIVFFDKSVYKQQKVLNYCVKK